ncbi:MAG TPA: hypothetical protein VMW19_11280, partial [Myxococcota bacterium]|nr:hypothetical protein [Myxococcota bacterium]
SASFGSGSRTLIDTQTKDPQTGAPIPIAVDVPNDPRSGIIVSGPGTAAVLVGVVPFVFADADANHDGFITANEFSGSQQLFDSYDSPFQPKLKDNKLSPSEAPSFVPSATFDNAKPADHVGELRLPDVGSAGTTAGGIETVGNNVATSLPAQGARLTVVAAGDVLLGSRGSIGTLEGGDVTVASLTGAVRGGVPPAGTIDQRGIFSLYASPTSGASTRPAEPTGGGDILVDAYGDIDVGGLAIAALSGGDITVGSRAASFKGGVSSPFADPSVRFDPQANLVVASFEGGGLNASGDPKGDVTIKAVKDIDIGAGITGGNINLGAGGNITSSGSGAIAGSTVTLGAAGTITGNVSAVGAVTVTGGTVTGGSMSSSTGLVTGAGSGVGSNAGGSKTSADTNLASQQMAQNGSLSGSGLGDAAGAGGPRQGVRIDVSSQPCKNRVTCD